MLYSLFIIFVARQLGKMFKNPKNGYVVCHQTLIDEKVRFGFFVCLSNILICRLFACCGPWKIGPNTDGMGSASIRWRLERRQSGRGLQRSQRLQRSLCLQRVGLQRKRLRLQRKRRPDKINVFMCPQSQLCCV